MLLNHNFSDNNYYIIIKCIGILCILCCEKTFTHRKIAFDMKKLIVIIMFLPLLSCGQQQEVDNDYTPEISKPLYGKKNGPLLLIDGGHNNFHTLDGKFAPFGKVATADGFTLGANIGVINRDVLKGVKILVIANALNEKNIDHWQQPIYPAFSADEIETVREWVYNGGSLFLIADHMPFAGAVADLAKEMGYTLYDGFAMSGPGKKYDEFSVENNMLKHTTITDKNGSVDKVITYTGHAFKVPNDGTSILTFDAKYKVLMPEEAWKFSKGMKMIPADGLSQLAYSSYGKGKVVVSGEAAMFTAQKVPGVIKFGLNADMPNDNLQLLLNILEWLST